MSGAQAAIELAAYQALSSSIAGGSVYQHVPDEASDWPIVVIGDIDTYPFDAKSASPDRSGSLIINTVDRAEQRLRLIQMNDQVETILGGQKFEADGFKVTFQIESAEAVRDESGNFYVGFVRLSVWAVAA